MILSVSYRAFPINFRSKAYPVGRIAYRPTLRVVASRSRRTFAVIAIVDTGADYTLFPLTVAHQLGLEDSSGKELGCVRLLGRSAPAYIHPVTLCIEDRIQIRCDVAFTAATHVGLLGQCGFFDRIDRLSLYPQQQRFEIECGDGLAIPPP